MEEGGRDGEADAEMKITQTTTEGNETNWSRESSWKVNMWCNDKRNRRWGKRGWGRMGGIKEIKRQKDRNLIDLSIIRLQKYNHLQNTKK